MNAYVLQKRKQMKRHLTILAKLSTNPWWTAAAPGDGVAAAAVFTFRREGAVFTIKSLGARWEIKKNKGFLADK